ncbi:uncharacterized protein RCC_10345 [Ramularia collo-cygni]|uniref:Uncharacterized protein n=1 Tax=Ramularia collo-cygni TaxID=112498 RepID=A0A2D3VC96_9PEZI|nr:uncharacterized protein RCC_10345 [Ramularia collo-cygni]CZT24620.1 uncharacterized protein RCC_10345 [Ramularia collo-cygni]
MEGCTLNRIVKIEIIRPNENLDFSRRSLRRLSVCSIALPTPQSAESHVQQWRALDEVLVMEYFSHQQSSTSCPFHGSGYGKNGLEGVEVCKVAWPPSRSCGDCESPHENRYRMEDGIAAWANIAAYIRNDWS